MKENIAIIFSAYNLQIINFKMKTSVNYITNDEYYDLIFSKLYLEPEKYYRGNKFCESNIDLRGGGYLVLNSNYFFSRIQQGNYFSQNIKIFQI